MKRALIQCIVATASVCAWNYEGHLLSAGVAECLLTDQTPEVLSAASSLLDHLKNN